MTPKKPRKLTLCKSASKLVPMLSYLIRRLLLIFPTLFGIMVLNFALVQVAPGGPVEQMIARLTDMDQGVGAQFGGSQSDFSQAPGQHFTDFSGGGYRGAQGLDPAFIAEIEKMFGFDKPPLERFFFMMKKFLLFDFGESYFRDRRVVDLILERLPVSISLGLWTFLLSYLISIPLGIRKAVRDGSRFDMWTSTIVIIGNAIPAFLLAILLIILFAGGRYFDWFPLRGLVSEDWQNFSWPMKIVDYFWHMALPILALILGQFAQLTMLTKNSFLDEISKNYVLTARAKGLTQHRILYGHIFRNAMLIVIAAFPAALIGVLFTGAFMIEYIFSLDGLGYLGYEAIMQRDYPIIFATTYFFALVGLVFKIMSDFTYHLVDPRIEFSSHGT